MRAANKSSDQEPGGCRIGDRILIDALDDRDHPSGMRIKNELVSTRRLKLQYP